MEIRSLGRTTAVKPIAACCTVAILSAMLAEVSSSSARSIGAGTTANSEISCCWPSSKTVKSVLASPFTRRPLWVGGHDVESNEIDAAMEAR